LYLEIKTSQLDMPVRLVILPHLVKGQPELLVTWSQIGNTALTPRYTALVQDIVNDVLQDALSGYRLTRLEIGGGYLLVSGEID